MLYKKNIIGTVGYMGGIPAVLEPFCWAWGQMIQYNSEYLCQPGEIVNYIKATVSLHFFARNSLVEGMKGDWLLMLDTDHAFDPDIVVRMLDYMNKYDAQVVTAMYRHKSDPGGPVIYNWDEKGFAVPIADWVDENGNRNLNAFQIDSAGGGCLLVRREVFKRIDSELKEKPFDIISGFGEDHSFFKRLEKLKIPAYALLNVESPHLQIQKLTMDNYNFKNSSVSPDRKETEGFI